MTENKKSKTAEILEMLKAGVESVFESDAYKKYLEFVGKFRHYSWANTMLIMLQAPETRYVASWSDWRNKFSRYVKKSAGNQRIRIIAPHTRKETDEHGNDRIVVGFHAATVYPIEATTPIGDSGEDIPELCRPLCDDVDNFERLRDVLVDISPVPVAFESFSSDAYGYYSPKELKIVIKDDIAEAQTIKTMMHEIAHSWLHCEGGECENADRHEMETQAESVAFAVASWLGLDTSTYSFEYLASWAKDRSLPELKSSLAIIQRTAVKMMDMIERRLEGELHQGAATNAC